MNTGLSELLKVVLRGTKIDPRKKFHESPLKICCEDVLLSIIVQDELVTNFNNIVARLHLIASKRSKTRL